MDFIMNNWDKWLIIIPARFASTRLPEKPLADLLGKPLIVRVYERIRPLADHGAEVIIATDHQKIFDVCHEAGIQVQMTRLDHQSGTDRCAEVAASTDKPFILNVQGDEPFVSLADLQRLMGFMESESGSAIATLGYRNSSNEDFANPNIVKAVRGDNQRALYFSRSPIPYYRDQTAAGKSFIQHLGVYAYRREVLFQFCRLAPSVLEQTERLEQLRALEAGIAIHLIDAGEPTIGIDTPEDLERARQRLLAHQAR
jgi:3-deoxy-manno-octulosonate cytidylyltransferase (CMP-KDO synthetase)